MPSSPSRARPRISSAGKAALRSRSCAAGSRSLRAKARAMPWISRSRALGSKSMVSSSRCAAALGAAGRSWLSIAVEAAPALASQPAGGDIAAQQRRRAVLVLAQFAVQHLGDRQAGIEPDHVGELEGAHRVVEPEPDALVDAA